VNFRRSVIIAELWRPEVARRKKIWDFCVLFRKTINYGKIFKILFRKFLSQRWSTYCIQISWNLADGISVKSCVIYVTKKFRLALQVSLLLGSCPKSARASFCQCTHSAPDFIQIGSLSAE